MKILKQEKGSITLFVLISMLFFAMYLVGMYALSANSESSGIAETARIKEIYEQGINNIDDVYNTELQKSYKLLSKIAKTGDYVKYNTGVTTVGNNGVVTFRVLYNDEENGLQIISNKNVETVTLGGSTFGEGVISYNNAIELLNNEAMKYKGTLGIDARCVGSNPKNKNLEEAGPVQLEFSVEIENIDNIKATDTNYEIDKAAMEAANVWVTGEEYWLASRETRADNTSCLLNIRNVGIRWRHSSYRLF